VIFSLLETADFFDFYLSLQVTAILCCVAKNSLRGTGPNIVYYNWKNRLERGTKNAFFRVTIHPSIKGSWIDAVFLINTSTLLKISRPTCKVRRKKSP
jgi:hypothetical protein